MARATGTGSRFGEELDSLVDAISFGFAPALIMYLEIPNHGTWEWLLVFIFTACAVMRLARFNVEQAGRKKTHFHGLPSPAAGLTLASYYWFSQTPLYNQAVILFTNSKTLKDLPWFLILRGLMAVLAALMISDVPYPAVPSIGLGSVRKVIGSLVVGAATTLLVVGRTEFIFPALLAYVLYGAIKWVILGFLGRSSTPDEIFWEEENGDYGRESPRDGAMAHAGQTTIPVSSSDDPHRDAQRDQRREAREADAKHASLGPTIGVRRTRRRSAAAVGAAEDAAIARPVPLRRGRPAPTRHRDPPSDRILILS